MRLGRGFVVRVRGGRYLETHDRPGAQPGVAAARWDVRGGRGVRLGAQDRLDLFAVRRAEDGASPGVGPYGLGERVQAVELVRDDHRHPCGTAVPQGNPQELLRILPPVGGRQVPQRARTVQQDPEGALDVLGLGVSGLAGPVGGDEPPLGLVRRPLECREGACQAALHRQYAVPAGQEAVLAGAAALDDEDVAVLEGLQGERTHQGRAAAAGVPGDQQVGFRRAGAGPPDHRRGVPRPVAVLYRDGARDRVGVGEAQNGLTGGGDEPLGGDRGGECGEHCHEEVVVLLVPGEVVFAAPARLGVEHLFDPCAGRGVAVGEVRRVLHLEPGEPTVAVERVRRAEGLLPVAAVGEQRTRVVGRGEVRHQRLVERLEPCGSVLVGTGLRGGAVAPPPCGSAHHRDEAQQGPVGDERHHQYAGRDEEQHVSAPVLGRRGPLLPPRSRQQPKPTGDRDQRMEDIGGAVGGRARDLAAACDRSAAALKDAGEWSPGHVGLLKRWERFRGVRT